MRWRGAGKQTPGLLTSRVTCGSGMLIVTWRNDAAACVADARAGACVRCVTYGRWLAAAVAPDAPAACAPHLRQSTMAAGGGTLAALCFALQLMFLLGLWQVVSLAILLCWRGALLAAPRPRLERDIPVVREMFPNMGSRRDGSRNCGTKLNVLDQGGLPALERGGAPISRRSYTVRTACGGARAGFCFRRAAVRCCAFALVPLPSAKACCVLLRARGERLSDAAR